METHQYCHSVWRPPVLRQSVSAAAGGRPSRHRGCAVRRAHGLPRSLAWSVHSRHEAGCPGWCHRLRSTVRAELIRYFKACMTDIYLHIDARMADYIRTHPYRATGNKQATGHKHQKNAAAAVIPTAKQLPIRKCNAQKHPTFRTLLD